MMSCPFCHEIQGRPPAAIQDLVPNRILDQTEAYFVVPTLGQFLPGYILILSKDHLVSFADQPREDDAKLHQFIDAWVENLQREFDGACLIYEHGDTLTGAKGGACLAHAHIHILCVPHLESLAELEIPKGIPIDRNYLESIRPSWSAGTPYLYCELRGETREAWLIDATGLPSQFMRRRVAAFLGHPDDWDWGSSLGVDNIMETLRRLGSP